MKKILSAIAVLLTLTACNSNEPKAESAATTDGMAIVVCGDMQKALEETITYL